MATLAVGMLTIGSSALMTASSAPRAGATCGGVANPVTITHYNAYNTLVAEEVAGYLGTTCNGDYRYTGVVLDPVTDGSCAYANYVEPFAYSATQGVSCTTGAWSAYDYIDSIGSNSVLVSVRPSYLSDNWTTSSGY
ncbi:MAG TPA: hypothetical protein VGN51_17120 [Acidimicrobiia bacterium]|jgi:hypothetical protein